jgi:hypothetical protein
MVVDEFEHFTVGIDRQYHGSWLAIAKDDSGFRG